MDSSTGPAVVRLLNTLRDAVRAQLWPIPSLAVVVAVVAGFLLPAADAHVDSSLPAWLGTMLFGGDANAARTVLASIATSLISVTSLTFSLTVVTLQLASSQFSPRLLRTFASDEFVQVTLGLFLATFAYSLTALREVHSGSGAGPSAVPRIAVTVAFVLALLSVLGLVLFLAHLVQKIRVETMLRNVHQEANATIGSVLVREEDAESPREPQRPKDALPVLAPGSGFVNDIDEERLLAVAKDTGVLVELEAGPGNLVVERTPIGHLWALEAGARPEEARERIGRHVRIGFERTPTADVSHGLRQLTDVANKALSPGVNDPTTAIHALGHISALLCQLGERRLGPVVLTDEDGCSRVLLHRPGFGKLVGLALDQPRRYGGSDAQVVERILQVLDDLAWRVPPDLFPVLESQLERTRTAIRKEDFDDHERRALEGVADRVERRLKSRAGEATVSATGRSPA